MAAKKAKKGVVIGGNSTVVAAAKDRTPKFKRGGAARKEGGKIDGAEMDVRLDKRARGGSLKSPYSGAKSLDNPSSKARAGHEGEYVD